MTKSRAAEDAIRLRGVRHNNLKNFDLDIPVGKLTVITGLSGSGKSSLAFDTLFAEGQRRYIETFSPYARQFFDRMDKPQVDRIEGIPPAIAIEQRNSVRSTRSTVGTMTELCDYMKLLWPHLAQLHCKQCGQLVRAEPPQVVWEILVGTRSTASDDSRAECLITFTIPLSEKLALKDSLDLIVKQGYQRLLIGSEIVRIDEAPSHLTPHTSHLTVVQDRLKPTTANRARFIEACEQAYHFGKGRLTIYELDSNSKLETKSAKHFSNQFHCAACNLDYPESTPALFSFNHPVGACPACKGFGRIISIDYHLAIPDRSKTLAEGAVKPWQTATGAESQADLAKACKKRKVPMDVPFAELSEEQQRVVIDGDPDYDTNDPENSWPRKWYGVKGYFRWLESKSYKMHVRVLLSRYRAYTTCEACGGKRLKPEALLYRCPIYDLRFTIDDLKRGAGDAAKSSIVNHQSSITLPDFYSLSIEHALAFIESIAAQHSPQPNDPLTLALGEVRARLRYLVEVGLGYLTLDRPTRTLSGGETERVNLTTCLGTRLVNTLFVLDEPSVGLHPRDTARLVHILEQLRDTGNTVVVVEHEASVMRAADQIVDLGPGQGEKGGELVFCGPLDELMKSAQSLTGLYLSGRKQIELPIRRAVNVGQASSLSRISKSVPLLSTALALNDTALPYGNRLEACPTLRISNATRHNLKNLSIEIPLGRFIALTGVSGSGKTTLVREVLMPALEAKLKAQSSKLKAQTPAKASDRLGSDDDNEEQSSIINHQSSISGFETISQVVLVDQSPLGKTPRSNPVVYIGAFDDVRDLFAQTDLAKQRGLNGSAFSFNSGVGQCERCRGAGFEKIEMQFLSDIFIRCPECNGRRYREHILEVKLRSGARQWSIADMLDATVNDALDFLFNHINVPAGRRALARLKLLQDVGLGYLRLGQPINTLSGGESQRLKLVSHLAESAAASESNSGEAAHLTAKNTVTEVKDWLAKRGQGSSGETSAPAHTSSPSPKRTLFLFDEPTTGLHFDDVRVLLQVFQRIVDAGHSVVVIEHNLDVIKCADWVIDLGPDAGERGGELVIAGTPEEVAECEASHTGRFLREVLSSSATGSEGARKRGSEKRISSPHSPTSPLPHLPTAITIHGAREHNLKNLSLEIPRGKFVVVTGVSGSGKSTLAFDLLFAEGQRRFLDSMNAYARQFVEQLARPDVDLITGLPPTVSIEQRTTRGGGKSTVATVTEVYHFFRLLFARLGTQYCPDCQLPVEAQTRDALAAGLQKDLKRRGDLLLLAPVVRNRKGFHTDVAEWAAKHGYREIRADGKLHDTSKPFRLDRFKEHDVEIVVGVLDRKLVGTPSIASEKSRGKNRDKVELVPATKTPPQLVEETLDLGKGTLFALDNHGKVSIHSTERACPKCARSFSPLDPKNFSYNSAQGWCPKCRGFGELFYIPEVERGANADSIEESWWSWASERETCPDCNGARLKPESRAVRLNVGQASSLSLSLGQEATARSPRDRLDACPTVDALSTLSVASAYDFFRKLKLKGRDAAIARDILPEIAERLKFLDEVGLGYLQLGRAVTTLSGGEAQRIRLAAQLGSNLSGVLYVLDEPTIGLHARDNEQLLAALHQLQSRGNSLVVVEHDEETMRRADYVIDLGPGAGVHGGTVVAAGTLPELMRNKNSITGQLLLAQETKTYPARGARRPISDAPAKAEGKRSDGEKGRKSRKAALLGTSAPLPLFPGWLTLHHATVNNLKNLEVRFPLNRFVVVTGVSGSGKSTMVRECLLPAAVAAVAKKPRSGKAKPAKVRRSEGDSHVTGFESLKAVYEVDQSPIGRTPRSTPATYVGFFDEIRALFAVTPEAKMRGYSASRFSFNSAQGRCPECEGSGAIKLEMNFLPPAFVKCETCDGKRFSRDTLDIQYAGKNIAQVLDLSVEEALQFFAAHQKILRPLQALHDTGLDYIKLGQTSPTLSGGEAQRVKLVTHLISGLKPAPDMLELPGRQSPSAGKRNLFILEEPTIGLHMSDVHRLVEVIQRLVDAGHSVVVIEHNLDLIAEADWVIDLGPEGGEAGGQLVAEGTPEEVAKVRGSHTGRFLRQLLRIR